MVNQFLIWNVWQNVKKIFLYSVCMYDNLCYMKDFEWKLNLKINVENRKKLKYCKTTVKKLRKKVISLKNDSQHITNKNKQLSDDYVAKRIKQLPIKQQQMVEHYFKHQKENLTLDNSLHKIGS